MHIQTNWRVSAEGRPILLASSHPLDQIAEKRPILMIGGVHGDEPEGVHLGQSLFQWLKLSGQGHSRPLKSAWILIPCLNVDGFARGERTNSRGVDLNRNYPSANWSPESKGPRYFPGIHGGSEVETAGIVDLFLNCSPRLAIHFHSWEPCIVASGPGDFPEADALAVSSGYQRTENIGYPTPGSLSQFGWVDRQIPVICIEEQEKLTDFSPIFPRFERAFAQILCGSKQ